MKKLTLLLLLSITAITTTLAINPANVQSYDYNAKRIVTQDEIAQYIFEKYRETVIGVEPVEGSEDMLAYTVSGKVYLITIAEGNIIIASERPIE